VSNYLGIAILSTVGKLFELLVYRHMYENLKGQLAVSTHRNRKYQKIMHVEASTQITHPFAEAEKKNSFVICKCSTEKE
jgi:hypothetical protein